MELLTLPGPGRWAWLWPTAVPCLKVKVISVPSLSSRIVSWATVLGVCVLKFPSTWMEDHILLEISLWNPPAPSKENFLGKGNSRSFWAAWHCLVSKFSSHDPGGLNSRLVSVLKVAMAGPCGPTATWRCGDRTSGAGLSYLGIASSFTWTPSRPLTQ